MILAEKGVVEEMEIDDTREARRVPEQKNSARQNMKTDNLAAAIHALTEVLREEERDREVNERGKKHLQKAMEMIKGVKAELCDQLLRRLEQATSAPMHQNSHNKLNGALTWAAVVARGEPPVKTIPTKTLREVVITRRSCDAIPEAECTPEAIVKRANEAIKNITKGAVVAARHMPSGDIILMTDTQDTKAELAANNGWMCEWGDKARMKCEMYAVLVKSAPLNAIDWGTPERAVESIYKQNPTLWCRALIHKVDKITVKQQRPHGSVIINVAALHQVNTLIDSGIILGNEYCTAEIFHREAWVTRCFNCQQYEHIARFCQREETCSHCAQKGHSDKTCPGVLEGSKPKCSNCQGNHTVWNPSCPERIAVTKSVKEALIERPKRYEIRAPDTEGFHYPRKRNRSQQNELAEVPRRAGRPTDIARAGALQ
ncbi:hypothetical protein GX50_07791 [[Emmonsia] crescens]|uniref:CCHC-type domain-containing protein n=1 Tax=[Emmonsia] crescens TaxID=73230 RepID=A0A2B7Z6C2_9EURO|nr:hypothetical protein GX50_07791 [Emmonsia crescens]